MIDEEVRVAVMGTSSRGFATGGIVVVVPVTGKIGLISVEVPNQIVLCLESRLTTGLGSGSGGSLASSSADARQAITHCVEDVILEVLAADETGEVAVEAMPGEREPDEPDEGILEPEEPVVAQALVL